MAVAQISQRVLAAIKSRLVAGSGGFNQLMISQARAYGLEPFLTIDFSATSTNFFLAQVAPDLLEQTAIFTYPLLCLYILESEVTNDQKFQTFSGAVRAIIDVYLSYKNIRGKQDHESYASCVEDVVIDIMNREANQNWGNPLVYNGDIRCKRGPLLFAAENWRQRVGFSLLFGVHE